MQLSEESKERISRIIDYSRVTLHYGWIPLVIYLGWVRTEPRPALIKILSPIPGAG